MIEIFSRPNQYKINEPRTIFENRIASGMVNEVAGWGILFGFAAVEAVDQPILRLSMKMECSKWLPIPNQLTSTSRVGNNLRCYDIQHLCQHVCGELLEPTVESSLMGNTIAQGFHVKIWHDSSEPFLRRPFRPSQSKTAGNRDHFHPDQAL